MEKRNDTTSTPSFAALLSEDSVRRKQDRYGQRVVDHFSERPHSPYEQAETLEDLRDGLHIVRTLLKMGRHQQACDTYRGDLARSLAFNLEAHAEILSLLGPFFPQGWSVRPITVDEKDASILVNNAALSLDGIGESEGALKAYCAALPADISMANWSEVIIRLYNIANSLTDPKYYAKKERILLMILDIASLTGDNEYLFIARLGRFRQLLAIGRGEEAEALWQLLNPMGRDWSRAIYRPGEQSMIMPFFSFIKGI